MFALFLNNFLKYDNTCQVLSVIIELKLNIRKWRTHMKKFWLIVAVIIFAIIDPFFEVFGKPKK